MLNECSSYLKNGHYGGLKPFRTLVRKSLTSSVTLPAKTRADILKARKWPAETTNSWAVLAIRLVFLRFGGYSAASKLNSRMSWYCVFQRLCGLQPVYDTVSQLCLIQSPPKNLSADQTFAATVIVSSVDHFVHDLRNSACFLLKNQPKKPLTRNLALSLRHSIRLHLRNCFTKTQPHAPSHALQRSNAKRSLAESCPRRCQRWNRIRGQWHPTFKAAVRTERRLFVCGSNFPHCG